VKLVGGGEKVARRRRDIWLGAAAAVLLAATTPTVAQGIHPVIPATGQTAGEMVVPVNKSQTLRVDRSFSRALIGNPEIADIVPLTDRSLYVLGKKTGSTSLTIYDRQNQLVAVMDLVVGPDVQGLKRQLFDLLPNEQVGARVSNDSLVLSGTVASAAAVDRAVQIAETYAPGKVVNMMGVGSAQQVMLEVRFSEMNRNTARQLGINTAFRNNDGDILGGTGNDAVNTALLTDQLGRPVVDIASILESFGVIATNFSIGNLNITGVLDALETKGLVTTLAEPNLVAMSGDTASFLAGGEFPIPVARNNSGDDGVGTITIEFKEFGVSLAFTPTVLEDGLINLVVAPEVSSIDPNSSITLQGLVIPGLRTRRAKTTLELRDGQSFAIAGLIRNDFEDTVRQIPLLGSIPIIGTLFRSTGFRKQETELVIVVTPRLVRPTTPENIALPTDRVRPPSDADLFLFGRTDVTASKGELRPASTAGQVLGATKAGGIDGPHGHIVR
jgi:pilus assembly protein CpaC